MAYVTPPREEMPPEATTEVAGVAAPGGKPGMVTIGTHQLTTTVEAIDVANRMVTLKGPRGNVVTLPVKDDVKNLDKLKQADVLVVVAANATDLYGYAYYGWYWGWYYPGYPGYGWGYPGYAVPYEFTTGTLYIGMFDPDKADVPNKRLGGAWLAAINGLLGEGGNPQNRIDTTIDQAFAQSPYLGDGK